MYDLFPTPLLTYQDFLSEEYVKQVENLVANTEFEDKSNEVYGVNPSVSKNILKQVPEVKQEIIETFKEYARNILRIDFNVDFVIGSSWATLTKPGQRSSPHIHANYYYSGCYYVTDEPSSIEFQLGSSVYNHHERFMFKYIEHNKYNNNRLIYYPSKNEIIFFPSCLKHQIAKNDSNKNRHSIAFNIHPCGIYGRNDSQLHIQVIDDLD
jgi:uncharacterized protein (TIGR02466 family)